MVTRGSFGWRLFVTSTTSNPTWYAVSMCHTESIIYFWITQHQAMLQIIITTSYYHNKFDLKVFYTTTNPNSVGFHQSFSTSLFWASISHVQMSLFTKPSNNHTNPTIQLYMILLVASTLSLNILIHLDDNNIAQWKNA
jgi:hypothetical protein